MDHFGIGAGIEGATEVYFRSARRTGRTASLVESVKHGDRVVFLSEKEGRRVQKLCRDRGIDIEIIVSDPKGAPSGSERTIFDHSWVKAFYLNAIQQAQDDIDYLQIQTSGRGEVHRESQRAAWEMSKWHL